MVPDLTACATFEPFFPVTIGTAEPTLSREESAAADDSAPSARLSAASSCRASCPAWVASSAVCCAWSPASLRAAHSCARSFFAASSVESCCPCCQPKRSSCVPGQLSRGAAALSSAAASAYIV